MQNGKIATIEKIWAAANELTAEGKKATLVAVRKRIGGGSYTDISEAMEAWRSNNQSLTNETTSNLPNEQLNEFGAQIFAAVMEFGNGKLREKQAELERVKQESEKTKSEDTLTIQALIDLNNELKTSVEKLNERLESIQLESKYKLMREQVESENLKVAYKACKASLDAAMRDIEAFKATGKPARKKAVNLRGKRGAMKKNPATKKLQKTKDAFRTLDRQRRANFGYKINWPMPEFCSFCGCEDHSNKLSRYVYQNDDQLFVVDDVPYIVCDSCQEQYVDAPVMKKIEDAYESIMNNEKNPERIMQVAVVSFSTFGEIPATGKTTAITLVKVTLDDNNTEIMDGIIRCSKIVSEDENGNIIDHKELIDKTEYRSKSELIQDIAKRLNVDEGIVEFKGGNLENLFS